MLNQWPMLQLTARQRRELLGDRLAFIPQDAMRALNPMLPVGDQVGEPLVLHRSTSWEAARQIAVDLLRVGSSQGTRKANCRLSTSIFRRNAAAGHDCDGPST